MTIFFWDVAQLAMLAKQYLVGAYHLLPPQRPIDGDLTLLLSTGPDIALDAQTAPLSWSLPSSCHRQGIIPELQRGAKACLH